MHKDIKGTIIIILSIILIFIFFANRSNKIMQKYDARITKLCMIATNGDAFLMGKCIEQESIK